MEETDNENDEPSLPEDAPTIAADGTGKTSGKTSETPSASIRKPKMEEPGDSLGDYTLIEKIGEGGFGVVYLAEQTGSIRRTVALKIIKPGMDSAEILSRFEAEQQALAMLDHSGISRVFDVGATETGRPFFVMELVDGLPVSSYCDEKKIPLSDRLSIFREICTIVQHAHQKGVIHRDLKPSNILVTEVEGKPSVKIIDFGIAKSVGQSLTEDTVLTIQGQLLGTPQYMSPEQSGSTDGDTDTRTDIYSLGVILYELITGKTPFDTKTLRGAAIDEIVRIIRHETPPRPSDRLGSLTDKEITQVRDTRGESALRISKNIRGDLDWIVMKALEKERDRRYESASGFAEDVRRFLENEEVTARPPTVGYRLNKFARRNRGLLAATGVVILSLVAGISVSVSQAHRAKQQQVFAEESASETAAVLKFLQEELLSAPVPKAHGGLGQDTKLIDAVREAEEKIDDAFKGQPLAEAAIRKTIGDTYYALGEYEASLLHYEAVNKINLEQLGPMDEFSIHSLSAIGDLYRRLERFDDELGVMEILSSRIMEKDGPVQERSTWVNSKLADLYWDNRQPENALVLQENFIELAEAGRFESDSEFSTIFRRDIESSYAPPDFKTHYFSKEIRQRAIELNERVLNWGREFFGQEHKRFVQLEHDHTRALAESRHADDHTRFQRARFSRYLEEFGAGSDRTVNALNDLLKGLPHEEKKEELEAFVDSWIAANPNLKDLSRYGSYRTLLDNCSEVGINQTTLRLARSGLEAAKRLESSSRASFEVETGQKIKLLSGIAGLYGYAGDHEGELASREELIRLCRETGNLHVEEALYEIGLYAELLEDQVADDGEGKDKAGIILGERFEIATTLTDLSPFRVRAYAKDYFEHISGEDAAEKKLKLYGKVVDWHEQNVGLLESETLSARQDLELLAEDAHGSEARIEKIRERIKICEENAGPLDYRTVKASVDLAKVLAEAEKWEEATGIRETILERMITSRGALHSETIETRLDLAKAHLKSGENDRALATLDPLLKSSQQVSSSVHSLLLEGAVLVAEAGDEKRAEDWLLSIIGSSAPSEAVHYEAHADLCRIYLSLKEFSSAESHFLRWREGVRAGILGPHDFGSKTTIDPFAEENIPANSQVHQMFQAIGKPEESKKWNLEFKQLVEKRKQERSLTASADPFAETVSREGLTLLEELGSYQFVQEDWKYIFYPNGKETIRNTASNKKATEEDLIEMRKLSQEALTRDYRFPEEPPTQIPFVEVTEDTQEPSVSHTGIPKFVRFRNNSDTEVELFWIAPDGELHGYSSISSGGSRVVQTWEGAVWSIFRLPVAPLKAGYFRISGEANLEAVIPKDW